MTKDSQIYPFIDYLYALSENNRRGALADLRQGLSEPPATASVMFPYVARWVPDDARYTWTEKVYYLVAALFAYYQSGSGGLSKQRLTQGNIGDHCLKAAQKDNKSASFEMRFTALLKANSDDLPVILRQMISLLRSADVATNWNQLFHDLCRWNSETHYIQRQWANSYWAYQKPSDEQDQNQIS
jgi:CRISPR type I-E-associated protein CasB/Cse2